MKIACTDFTMYKKDNTGWTEELLRHGVSQLNIAVPNLPEREADREEIITYALCRGLNIGLHAPFGVNNITSTDSALRASSIANVKYTIDLSAKFHLGTVTFHPGRLTTDSDDPEAIWADMMDVVSQIAEYAKEKQVPVGIENMELRPYELVFTVEDLNRFARLGTDNPYFGVTIDFAHYVTLGKGLPDLKALKLPIHAVHLSQVADGKPHLPLTRTDGAVDVAQVCRLLTEYSYDGQVVLEIGPPLWESVEILKTITATI